MSYFFIDVITSSFNVRTMKDVSPCNRYFKKNTYNPLLPAQVTHQKLYWCSTFKGLVKTLMLEKCD